jgi:hypothetical protein
MSIPPGQEPRPGFTPRADQGRPGGRGDSGRPDGGYRRDDSGSRRPASGASGRGAGAGSRDTDRDTDGYWAGRPAPGPRPAGNRDAAASRDRDGASPQRGDPGYRDAREQPARRPDGRYPNDGSGRGPREGRDRGDRGWGGAPDRRDPRGGYRSGYGDSTNAAGRGSAAPASAGRDASATAARRAGTGPLATPGLRWVGTWRQRRAVLVLFAIALVGFVGTVVIGHDPGFLIGALLVVGSVVAAIGAQRQAVHKLIPLPALCYLVTSTVAGVANDWTNLKDSNELATSFLTWIGGGFFGLVVATVLVVLITFIRWLGSRLLVSGQFPDAPSGPGRTAPGPASRPRRDSAALGDRPARDRAPSGNAFEDNRGPRGAAGQSPGRGSRDARDDAGPRADRAPRPDRGLRDEDLGDPRPPRDARGREGSPREGSPRDTAPRDDARRPRPTDTGPRDIW